MFPFETKIITLLVWVDIDGFILVSLQGVGHVGQIGVLGGHGVSCFPAMVATPPITKILGVSCAYQTREKLQKKAKIIPSHKIGVTKGHDSHHTGPLWKYIASEREVLALSLRVHKIDKLIKSLKNRKCESVPCNTVKFFYLYKTTKVIQKRDTDL